jgi:hypothetical protein
VQNINLVREQVRKLAVRIAKIQPIKVKAPLRSRFCLRLGAQWEQINGAIFVECVYGVHD